MPGYTAMTGRSLVAGAAQGALLFADVGLSFWGGVDPYSGEVIDRHHPLSGEQLAGRVLAIPSGRGSCTGSSVMMELISNGHAPAALVLAEPDEILTLGVLVAQMIFQRSLPVLCIGREAFTALRGKAFARVDGASLNLFEQRPDDGWHPSAEALPGAGHTSSINLNEVDQALLDGQHGKAAQVAMQIVLRMAQLQGAPSLVDVTQAHIDGCIYTGPASLRFAEQLVQWGARVRVPTTLNSISVDQRRWRELGIDPALGEPASALGDAYMAMGAQLSFTCAPYLLDTAPKAGEQIVWAESNAVVYANSVLGARTVKHADFMDLCIALTGRAPQAGVYLEANRAPRRVVHIRKPEGADDAFWPMLGWLVGKVASDRIPLIRGLEESAPSEDDLKALCAAYGTTSAAPMLHIAGITPEAHLPLAPDADEVTLTLTDFARLWGEFNQGAAQVDLVALGSPHFSRAECEAFADLMRGKQVHPAVTALITLGRATLAAITANGTAKLLREAGVRIVPDLCWCSISEPVFPPAAKVLMTNSGKYAHYAPGLSQREVRFGALAQCAQTAVSGQAATAPPEWIAAD